MDDCIFCTRHEQPPALVETAAVYLMPDKFPVRPGHLLAISTAHLACYGAASPAVERELDEIVARAAAFLTATYGEPVICWENGIAGQSVAHAHLHLIPFPATVPAALSAIAAAHSDVEPIGDWGPVRAWFARHDAYHYLAFAGQRYVMAGHSPAVQVVWHAIARETELRRKADNKNWLKTTTPTDVHEAARHWAAWVAMPAATGLLPPRG